MGKKIHPWVSEDFLGPKVTTPQIWESAEISTGLGVFFENFELPDFLKKTFLSLFTPVFFSIFFQKLSKSKGH